MHAHDLERGRKATKIEKVIAICKAVFNHKKWLIFIISVWLLYAALRQHGGKLINMTTLGEGPSLGTPRPFRRALTIPEQLMESTANCATKENYHRVGETIMEDMQIVAHSEEQVSVKHAGNVVKRWKEITLTYQDRGQAVTFTVMGFDCYCAQYLLELKDRGRTEL